MVKHGMGHKCTAVNVDRGAEFLLDIKMWLGIPWADVDAKVPGFTKFLVKYIDYLVIERNSAGRTM
jgi:hypothetical protein